MNQIAVPRGGVVNQPLGRTDFRNSNDAWKPDQKPTELPKEARYVPPMTVGRRKSGKAEAVFAGLLGGFVLFCLLFFAFAALVAGA